ncbi:uncharacterized protein EI90DRAFT_3014776 [Cantharellus anzutake]|uniref:uncharacterized protein n=1 Tax=Cantharellus anzutake TaxID=1750568 RepID=UPI001908DCA0|nr:uncharacterized protein EI90DRAFT_3014776 [Cantharellus anzutake]KAF8334943.1 hypothetical protein EI90DRAFT_3014776 [Cantharellus anzutake]
MGPGVKGELGNWVIGNWVIGIGSVSLAGTIAASDPEEGYWVFTDRELWWDLGVGNRGPRDEGLRQIIRRLWSAMRAGITISAQGANCSGGLKGVFGSKALKNSCKIYVQTAARLCVFLTDCDAYMCWASRPKRSGSNSTSTNISEFSTSGFNAKGQHLCNGRLQKLQGETQTELLPGAEEISYAGYERKGERPKRILECLQYSGMSHEVLFRLRNHCAMRNVPVPSQRHRH